MNEPLCSFGEELQNIDKGVFFFFFYKLRLQKSYMQTHISVNIIKHAKVTEENHPTINYLN